MEDDNGLDLSLSLPYDGPSTSFKGKNGAEEADRGSKLIDDFKNFLDYGTQNEDYVVGSQRSNNKVKPDEKNLFYDLSNSTANGGFWGKNDGRSSEVQEMKHDTSSKRKNLFDEINDHKRHEREARLVDLQDKTTDDDLFDGLKTIQATTPVNLSKLFDEGSSSHGTGDQSRADRCPPEHPTITPGLSAEVKFGGSGSSPDLPWVSTTGPGPNGKTISGVTYKHNAIQVRIVCACHGSHMSVEEFAHHATQQQPDPSFPNSNPTASTQS